MFADNVTILGTEYSIRHEKDCSLLDKNTSGICDFTTKTIYIKDNGIPNHDTVQDLEVYEKATLRHEIVHAFMFESGLAHNSHNVERWAQDDELIDWIAFQHKKLHKAFKEAGAL